MNVKSLPLSVKIKLQSEMYINCVQQCVSELVFNSLDAKSTSIAVRVNLLNFRIQVVDNGKGISLSNMNLVGTRYMTSKCPSIKSIQRKAKSFGVRGEALASMCCISRSLDIMSRPEKCEITCKKTFENGEWGATETIKCRPSPGTTITIEGFMYNLPVRQQRVTEDLDFAEIRSFMEKLAIIHNKVSFSLRNDVKKQMVLQIHKTGIVTEVLASLYPEIITSDLRELSISKNNLSITGVFYTNPSNNTKLQIIYVNKRPIFSQKLQKLINELLQKSLIFNRTKLQPRRCSDFGGDLYYSPPNEKEQHPVYILNIHCPYAEMDLLRNSSKTTVEFKHWSVVLKSIEKMVTGFLNAEGLLEAETMSKKNKIDKIAVKELVQSQRGVSQISRAIKSVPIKRKCNEKIYDSPEKAAKISKVIDSSNNRADVLPESAATTNKNMQDNSEVNDENFKKYQYLASTEKNHTTSKDFISVNSLNKHIPEHQISKTNDSSNSAVNAQNSLDKDDIFNKLLLNHNKSPTIKTRQHKVKKTKNILQLKPPVYTSKPSNNAVIKSIFDKHQHTQSLVINSELEESKIRDYNESVTTVGNQEKGKTLIMNMFLKSVIAFPHETSATQELTNNSNANKLKPIRNTSKLHNATMTISVNMQTLRTVVTNSYYTRKSNKTYKEKSMQAVVYKTEAKVNLKEFGRKMSNIDDNNSKSKPQKCIKMVSKCMQTTIIEDRNLTLSKYFLKTKQKFVTDAPDQGCQKLFENEQMPRFENIDRLTHSIRDNVQRNNYDMKDLRGILGTKHNSRNSGNCNDVVYREYNTYLHKKVPHLENVDYFTYKNHHVNYDLENFGKYPYNYEYTANNFQGLGHDKYRFQYGISHEPKVLREPMNLYASDCNFRENYKDDNNIKQVDWNATYLTINQYNTNLNINTPIINEFHKTFKKCTDSNTVMPLYSIGARNPVVTKRQFEQGDGLNQQNFKPKRPFFNFTEKNIEEKISRLEKRSEPQKFKLSNLVAMELDDYNNAFYNSHTHNTKNTYDVTFVPKDTPNVLTNNFKKYMNRFSPIVYKNGKSNDIKMLDAKQHTQGNGATQINSPLRETEPQLTFNISSGEPVFYINKYPKRSAGSRWVHHEKPIKTNSAMENDTMNLKTKHQQIFGRQSHKSQVKNNLINYYSRPKNNVFKRHKTTQFSPILIKKNGNDYFGKAGFSEPIVVGNYQPNRGVFETGNNINGACSKRFNISPLPKPQSYFYQNDMGNIEENNKFVFKDSNSNLIHSKNAKKCFSENIQSYATATRCFPQNKVPAPFDVRFSPYFKNKCQKSDIAPEKSIDTQHSFLTPNINDWSNTAEINLVSAPENYNVNDKAIDPSGEINSPSCAHFKNVENNNALDSTLCTINFHPVQVSTPIDFMEQPPKKVVQDFPLQLIASKSQSAAIYNDILSDKQNMEKFNNFKEPKIFSKTGKTKEKNPLKFLDASSQTELENNQPHNGFNPGMKMQENLNCRFRIAKDFSKLDKKRHSHGHKTQVKNNNINYYTRSKNNNIFKRHKTTQFSPLQSNKYCNDYLGNGGFSEPIGVYDQQVNPGFFEAINNNIKEHENIEQGNKFSFNKLNSKPIHFKDTGECILENSQNNTGVTRRFSQNKGTDPLGPKFSPYFKNFQKNYVGFEKPIHTEHSFPTSNIHKWKNPADIHLLNISKNYNLSDNATDPSRKIIRATHESSTRTNNLENIANKNNALQSTFRAINFQPVQVSTPLTLKEQLQREISRDVSSPIIGSQSQSVAFDNNILSNKQNNFKEPKTSELQKTKEQTPIKYVDASSQTPSQIQLVQVQHENVNTNMSNTNFQKLQNYAVNKNENYAELNLQINKNSFNSKATKDKMQKDDHSLAYLPLSNGKEQIVLEKNFTMDSLFNKLAEEIEESNKPSGCFNTGTEIKENLNFSLITGIAKDIPMIENVNQNLEDEWIKENNMFGNGFYVNTRTGMTLLHTPKENDNFNFVKRIEFVPKGLSPILTETEKIDKSLSPFSKKSLHNAIMESHENELLTVKWQNYIQNDDVNQFFKDLYREKCKQFEYFIPNASSNELPPYLLKMQQSLESQSFTNEIFEQIEIIGQVDNKFIAVLIKPQQLVMLFDQHAVHERIQLEKLWKGYTEGKTDSTIKFKSQKCHESFTIEFPEVNICSLDKYKSIFEQLGLIYKLFPDKIEVLQVPECLYVKSTKYTNKTEEHTLKSLVFTLILQQLHMLRLTRGVGAIVPYIIQDVINSEACRSAIKFGEKLTMAECNIYLKNLGKCKLPFQCAHGRPTLTPILNLTEAANFVIKQSKPCLKKLGC